MRQRSRVGGAGNGASDIGAIGSMNINGGAMALGHPILGDPLYADPESFAKAPRMTLHATHLDLEHPLTGETLVFDSPVPF